LAIFAQGSFGPHVIALCVPFDIIRVRRHRSAPVNDYRKRSSRPGVPFLKKSFPPVRFVPRLFRHGHSLLSWAMSSRQRRLGMMVEDDRYLTSRLIRSPHRLGRAMALVIESSYRPYS
jgi:hypothetical protein